MSVVVVQTAKIVVLGLKLYRIEDGRGEFTVDSNKASNYEL